VVEEYRKSFSVSRTPAKVAESLQSKSGDYGMKAVLGRE
jgi:hypothetical protein